jgi:hypothetical protein
MVSNSFERGDALLFAFHSKPQTACYTLGPTVIWQEFGTPP